METVYKISGGVSVTIALGVLVVSLFIGILYKESVQKYLYRFSDLLGTIISSLYEQLEKVVMNIR